MKKSIWVGLHATTSFSFGPLLAASMVAGGALLPGMAAAQDAASAGSNEAPAIVVTANHREQKLESVPYSISVVSADQLSNAGITDLASLTQNLPGLSMYDAGARMAGATVPIIRGINATGEPTRGFRNFEQSPVGVYINNSPVEGYIQLDDIKQVEVLRGPQGTLYGAGSLGGALRLLPNAPEFGKLEGNVTGSIGTVSHASQPSYTMGGMLNIPLGDTLAFRGSVKYARDPGHRCLWPDAPERGFGDRLAAARQSGRSGEQLGHLLQQEGLELADLADHARGAGLAAGRQAQVRAGLPAFVREGRWRPAGQPRFRAGLRRSMPPKSCLRAASTATLPASTSRSRATPT
jgi:outer membrane receptor protein involved in Fe transport